MSNGYNYNTHLSVCFRELPNAELFWWDITPEALYPEDSKAVPALLKELATQPIEEVG